MKKKTGVALLLACSLAFGAIGAGAATQLQKVTAYFDSSKKVVVDGKSYTNKVMTYKGTVYVPLSSYSKAVGEKISYDSKKKTYFVGKKSSTNSSKSTTSKTGVFKYSTNVNTTTASKELKTEAVSLIKIYADSLSTGKVSAFNTYVDQHVYEFDHIDWTIGRKYNKDNYKQHIDQTIKANSKNIVSYSKALKSVNTSTLEIRRAEKNSNGLHFEYSYQPSGWDAFSTVYVTLDFQKLKNGSYVLESIYY